MRSLIVEDDFTNRMILKGILSPYGECDIVVDGNEAIQAVAMALDEKKPYDLICMDIMMPNMDGLTAIDKIREVESQMGIRQSNKSVLIMTTSRAESDDIKKAMKAGATWYFVKPIDRKKLLDKLREVSLI